MNANPEPADGAPFFTSVHGDLIRSLEDGNYDEEVERLRDGYRAARQSWREYAPAGAEVWPR